MHEEKFETPVEAGHKGLFYLRIPFDPSVTWDARSRHFVRGSVNGCPFEGEVGFRRRKFYMLLDEELLRAAKLSPGDTVQVSMGPREPTEEELSSKAGLAWGRLASGEKRRPRKKAVTPAATTEARPARTPARKKPQARKRTVKKPA